MSIVDLPYEIVHHILSYNIFPWCLSTCPYLYDVEIDLMEKRRKSSEEYPYLDDAINRHGYEMFLYLLYYSEREISSIDDLLKGMIERGVNVGRLLPPIMDRCNHHELLATSLYENRLSHLIVDVGRTSSQIDDILSVSISNHDIETTEWLLIYGASLDQAMDNAVMYNEDRLISILVDRYQMDYPIW